MWHKNDTIYLLVVSKEMKNGKWCGHHHGSQSEAIYGLGVIGALFYFLQSAVGFGPVVVAIAKAIFWPAFVVFKALGILGL